MKQPSFMAGKPSFDSIVGTNAMNTNLKTGFKLNTGSQESWLEDIAPSAGASDAVGGFGDAVFALAAAGIASVSTVSGIVATTAGLTPGATTATPAWVAALNDPALKAAMTAAAANGIVTEAGMAKVFGDLVAELTATKTTLSAGQFAGLKTIAASIALGGTASPYVTYVTNALVNGNAANARWTGGTAASTTLGNLAAGASATQMSELDGKWFLGTDLPISIVAMSGHASFTVSYSGVSAPLYAAGGPSMNDINQGYLGDCYLLSSLAEVAKQNPSIIQSMITDNGNNTYGVRFYINGSAQYVTVNNALANGGSIFNHATGDWASLIEKAYAQIQASGVITGTSGGNYGNSFSTVGNGGFPAFALEEITGATTITNFSANGSTWGKYVYNSSLSYQSGTAGLSTASVLAILVADLAAGFDAVLTSRTNATDSSGKITLVAGHALSVYGYDSGTGNLQIRNPWGTANGQSWDTTFEISLGTLLAVGDTITVDNATHASPVVSAALVSAAAGLQSNAQVTAFTVSDTSVNVAAGLTSLAGNTKLTSIVLTDAAVQTISLTSAQYTAGTAILAKIASVFRLSVTGAPVSSAGVLQADGRVTGFTVSDTLANVAGGIAAWNGDTRLTAITLTNTGALPLTYAQLTANTVALSKLPGLYTLAVTGVPAANAVAMQGNSHVVSFSVADTAANTGVAVTALNAETKLSSVSVSGTTTGDTLVLTGSRFAAAIDLKGDSASASGGLTAPGLTFIGAVDSITLGSGALGSGATTISYALQPAGGIETIANFQYGRDQLAINLTGAANSALRAADTTVNGVHAISLYSSADLAHGIVLLGMSSSLTAANLLSSHTTFGNGQALVA